MNRYTLVKDIVANIENGIFVEIGTHEGNFADHILGNSKNSILYCIDPYIKYNEYEDAMNNTVGDNTYNTTMNKLKNKYGERVIFIRKFSEDALNDIPDNIDFLYIDGNHRYKYVIKELELFYPKVKKNCWIIGDDAVDVDDSKRNENGDVLITWREGCYGQYGVVKAFREFCYNNNIKGTIFGNQYGLLKKE